MKPSLLITASPLLVAVAIPAQAADLRVTTFLDEYDGQCTRQHCSLRDAVTAANDLGVARIILQAGEYRLSRENPRDDENEIIEEDENLIGDLDVTGELTVIGQGIQATTINGGQVDRVFEAHPQARLVLRNLGITGGRTPREGGGLYNQGYAELIGVRIYNNYAASMFIRGQGGGRHCRTVVAGAMTTARSRRNWSMSPSPATTMRASPMPPG